MVGAVSGIRVVVADLGTLVVVAVLHKHRIVEEVAHMIGLHYQSDMPYGFGRRPG